MGETHEIHVVLLQRDKWWVAQCLQYDIGAQAHTVDDVLYELQRSIVGHMAICEAHGRRPFVDLPAAPEMYWKKFKGTTVRVEQVDEATFRVPGHARLPRAEYRLAA